jgi:hypothetical protein
VGRVLLLHQQAEIQAGGAAAYANNIHVTLFIRYAA